MVGVYEKNLGSVQAKNSSSASLKKKEKLDALKIIFEFLQRRERVPGLVWWYVWRMIEWGGVDFDGYVN